MNYEHIYTICEQTTKHISDMNKTMKKPILHTL